MTLPCHNERTFVVISPDMHGPEVIEGDCLEVALGRLCDERLDQMCRHPDRYTVYEAHVQFLPCQTEAAARFALENQT